MCRLKHGEASRSTVFKLGQVLYTELSEKKGFVHTDLSMFFFYPAEVQWTFNQGQKALIHARHSAT